MQKIHVRWGYAVSLGQYIPAGIYGIDDERLLGLGQYLLDNGHALTVDAPIQREDPHKALTEKQVASLDDDDDSADDLTPADIVSKDLIAVALAMDFDAMTRAELRTLAADLGLAVTANMSKTEVLETLTQWRNQHAQG